MCDTLVAVGDATASGATLFGKNSDRHRGECQPLLQFSEASHPDKSRVRCTHIEIPQVAETYRVLGHSPWWVWGFEHGVNEHAVAVGNLQVFSNEPIEERPGLIGMHLVLFPENSISCVFLWWFLPNRPAWFSFRSFWLILPWFALNVYGAVYSSARIAYSAHIGGFLAGVGLAPASSISAHFAGPGIPSIR